MYLEMAAAMHPDAIYIAQFIKHKSVELINASSLPMGKHLLNAAADEPRASWEPGGCGSTMTHMLPWRTAAWVEEGRKWGGNKYLQAAPARSQQPAAN